MRTSRTSPTSRAASMPSSWSAAAHRRRPLRTLRRAACGASPRRFPRNRRRATPGATPCRSPIRPAARSTSSRPSPCKCSWTWRWCCRRFRCYFIRWTASQTRSPLAWTTPLRSKSSASPDMMAQDPRCLCNRLHPKFLTWLTLVASTSLLASLATDRHHSRSGALSTPPKPALSCPLTTARNPRTARMVRTRTRKKPGRTASMVRTSKRRKPGRTARKVRTTPRRKPRRTARMVRTKTLRRKLWRRRLMRRRRVSRVTALARPSRAVRYGAKTPKTETKKTNTKTRGATRRATPPPMRQPSSRQGRHRSARHRHHHRRCLRVRRCRSVRGSRRTAARRGEIIPRASAGFPWSI
mmetsp:Transcript_80211/g.259916  ORF Transcript_80211/g.259916 Transcript_80211/m.259916 type:complete len:354 (+) Transcript_80211:155-1216(+)